MDEERGVLTTVTKRGGSVSLWVIEMVGPLVGEGVGSFLCGVKATRAEFSSGEMGGDESVRTSGREEWWVDIRSSSQRT